jgi:hypothetical protein
MNRNDLLTKLHDIAMDAISETLIELQDSTADVGEIPRRFADWSDEDGAVLWWDTSMTGGEITEAPGYIGAPSWSDWSFETEDQPRLLWVPLPKLARNRP